MRSSHYFFHFIEIWQLIVIWFTYFLSFSMYKICWFWQSTVKLWLIEERNNNVTISFDITYKKIYNLEYLPITLKFSQINYTTPFILATSYIRCVFRGTAWFTDWVTIKICAFVCDSTMVILEAFSTIFISTFPTVQS